MDAGAKFSIEYVQVDSKSKNEHWYTLADIGVWTLQNDELCDKTACPISKGQVDVVYKQLFPIITPPVRPDCICCWCIMFMNPECWTLTAAHTSKCVGELSQIALLCSIWVGGGQAIFLLIFLQWQGAWLLTSCIINVIDHMQGQYVVTLKGTHGEDDLFCVAVTFRVCSSGSLCDVIWKMFIIVWQAPITHFGGWPSESNALHLLIID